VDPTIFVRESFIFAGNFLVAAIDLLASLAATKRGGDGSPSLASLQEKEVAMDLLRPRAKKGGGAQKKEAARGGTRIVAREDSYHVKLPLRGEYGHDKESKILGISKLPRHCVYAKMPSLVHQMSSLPKCISQMQNCWRAIFKVFGKF